MKTLLLLFVSSVAFGQAIAQGGITISGSPAANQVTLFNNASSVKGDSNLTWAPSTKTLTITGTALNGDALVIPAGARIDFNGGVMDYNNSFSYLETNIPFTVFGNIKTTGAGRSISTSGGTNNIAIADATTTNPVTITGSGGDATVGINLVPKSTGTIQNNGDPIIALHHAQATTQTSIEFGAAAATANALAVSFAASFSAAPSCTCADVNAGVSSACGISTTSTGSGVTF